MIDLSLVKKACSYNSVKKYALISMVVMALFWGGIMVVCSSYFHDNRPYLFGIVVLLVLEIINLIIAIISVNRLKKIKNSDDYKAEIGEAIRYYCHIEDEDPFKNVGNNTFVDSEGMVRSVREMEVKFYQQPKLVLKAMGLKMPVCGILVIVVSCLMLVFVHVPHIIVLNKGKIAQEKALVVAMEEIEQTLSQFGEGNYFVDGPEDYYSRYGYYSYGYVDYEDFNTYLGVHCDRDGSVDSLEYTVNIDMNKTKEENLSFVKEKLDYMYNIWKNTKVAVDDEVFLEPVELTDSFKEEFRNGEYTKEIYENNEVGDTAIVYTYYYFGSYDEQEDYDAKISVSMRRSYYED